MAQSNGDPTKSLENQLRSMILNNVTAGPSHAQPASQVPRQPRAQYQNARGRGRGRANGNEQSTHPASQGRANGNDRGNDPSPRGGRDHSRGGRARGRGNHALNSMQYQRNDAPPKAPQVLQRPRPDIQAQNHQSASNGPSTGRPGFSAWRAKARPSKFVPLHPRPVPSADMINSQALFLDNLAAQILPVVEISPEELHRKEAFRTELETICQEVLVKHYPEREIHANLLAFGSISSGFATSGSDMDLSYMPSADTPGFFRHMEKELLDRGIGAHLLVKTRVPIIKICQSPTPELLTALRGERQKWDDMTPEERLRHDTDAKPELEAAEEAKHDASVDHEHLTEEIHDDAFASKGVVADTKPITDCDAADKRPPQTAEKKTRGQKKRNSSNAAAATTAAKGAASPDNEPRVDTLAAQDNKVPLSEINEPSIASSQPSKEPEPSQDPSAPQDPSASQDLPSQLSTTKPPQPPRPRKTWYREKRLGPLDFPPNNVGIHCDINQANPLGIHNTTLLRCYSHCDPRVRAMILFVKAWASARKINSARNGTLSSYGYVLMVLHFLLNVAVPPVCPNLQHARKTEADCRAPPDPRDPNSMCEGMDVRFWRNEAEIRSLASKGFLTHNRQPLGLLLRNFFGYYAQHDGFVWMKQVLSLRTPGGILTKEGKGWTGARTTMQEMTQVEVKNRYLCAIEDPFEIGHNVARTVTHNGIVAVRDEFRRAWRVLQGVGRGERDVEDLMAVSESAQPPLEVELQAEKQEKEGGVVGVADGDTAADAENGTRDVASIDGPAAHEAQVAT